MASRKRAREEPCFDMQIIVAAGEALQAESFILRTFSSVARALPAGTQQWDVSGLLHDGQPFMRETVRCWLSCARSSAYGAAELEPEDVEQLSTVHQLHHVLTFAQAVGSSEGLLAAACSKVKKLQVHAPLSDETLKLQLSPGAFYFWSNAPLTLGRLHLSKPSKNLVEFETDEEKGRVQREIAEQIGALLLMGHVLRQQRLIDALHSFLFWSTAGEDGLLYGVLSLVFADAVVDAAIGSGTISKQEYINSVLSKPCSLASEYLGFHRLFTHMGVPKAVVGQPGALKFEARLAQDFGGGKAGDTVYAQLDLFRLGDDGGLWIEHAETGHEIWLPVQLWLGSSVSSAEEMHALMDSKMP